MIRTRDLLVFIVILICATIVGGIFFASYGHDNGDYLSPEDAIFLTPHEAYDAAPYQELIEEHREAFIDKVRRTYVPHEETVDNQEVVIRAPHDAVIPISSTTTPTTTIETYGGTGF